MPRSVPSSGRWKWLGIAFFGMVWHGTLNGLWMGWLIGFNMVNTIIFHELKVPKMIADAFRFSILFHILPILKFCCLISNSKISCWIWKNMPKCHWMRRKLGWSLRSVNGWILPGYHIAEIFLKCLDKTNRLEFLRWYLTFLVDLWWSLLSLVLIFGYFVNIVFCVSSNSERREVQRLGAEETAAVAQKFDWFCHWSMDNFFQRKTRPV